MKRTLLLMIIGCFYLLSKAQVSSSINLFEFDSHRSPSRGRFEISRIVRAGLFIDIMLLIPTFLKQISKCPLQQMGGNRTELVSPLQNMRIALTPVAIDDLGGVNLLYKNDCLVKPDTPGLAEGFSNFYCPDDVSAITYLSSLPSLASLPLRITNPKN